jgi:MFS family permease
LTGVARWLEFVAIAIFAYELTRSPALVALLAVLRMVPYVLLGFLTGAVADIINRKRLLVATFAMMAVASGIMLIVTALGTATDAAAAMIVMVSGAFWTTDMPVRRRLLVDAVEPQSVPVALGFDNATMYATRALGPLIGGATYQVLGISGIYALIAMSYLVCLAFATRVGVQSEATSGGVPSARTRLGFLLPPRELILDRRFQIIMGVTLVYNLWCWPFTGMVPVIGQNDFALTPAFVGALSACDGLGGTVGALAVGLLATPRTLFRFYFLGTLACLVLILGLALHLTIGAAVVVLLMSGVAAAAFSSTQYALVYNIAPPEMRGRATGMRQGAHVTPHRWTTVGRPACDWRSSCQRPLPKACGSPAMVPPLADSAATAIARTRARAERFTGLHPAEATDTPLAASTTTRTPARHCSPAGGDPSPRRCGQSPWQPSNCGHRRARPLPSRPCSPR